jgi:hypothetical protein
MEKAMVPLDFLSTDVRRGNGNCVWTREHLETQVLDWMEAVVDMKFGEYWNPNWIRQT